jgi:hypothetical protein
MTGFCPGQNRQPVYVGHDEIQENEREVARSRSTQQIEGRLPAGRARSCHSAARDRRFEQTPLHRVIVDNENCVGHNPTIFASER